MIALLAALALAAPPEDPLLEPLVAELERNAASLSLPSAPSIYHLRYQAVRHPQFEVQASLGSLLSSDYSPWNALFVEVRVGEPSFDNTGFGGWQNGFRSEVLPLDGGLHAARKAAWRATDRAYKEAVEQFARKQAQFSPPADYPGDYTLASAQVGDLGVADPIDPVPLTELALRLSAVLAVSVPEGSVLELGQVHLGGASGSVLLIDTEGTRLRLPQEETTIRATSHVRAADGMLLTDQRLWTVRRPEDLPSPEQMEADARAMAEHLAELSQAPALAEEYVGPVIFEDSAALDLFRYLLPGQLQGTPAEVPFDSWFGDLGGGNASAVRIKRRVLPVGWTVQDDPQRDPDSPAAFVYDAEGTPTRPLTLVEDGIVQDLYMSRVPRKDLAESNGYARGGLGSRALGLPSQWQVQPPDHGSRTKLRKKALKIASSYDRDWVIVVRRLQEVSARELDPGSTQYLDPQVPQLPMPVEIVRLNADGSEQVLRGAQFAGVQRFLLRDILAAGPQVQGTYMTSFDGEPWTFDPTSGLPTWMSAPEVLVGEMELIPAPGDARAVPLAPPPVLSADR